MKLSKEAQVGILALTTGVMLYFGFNFLKGRDFLSTTNKYYAVYQNIGGLAESNPVLINGLTVGKIKATKLLQEKNNSILVTIEIKKGIELNEQSIARIDETLLGTKSVSIVVGNGKAIKESGDTLIATVASGIFGSLQDKLNPLTDTLTLTLSVMKKRLEQFEQVEANLNEVLKTFNTTGGTLNQTLGENRMAIKSTFANLSVLSASINDPKTGIKPLLGKFNTLGDSLTKLELAKTLDNTNKTIKNLNMALTRINAGEGTLGKLMKTDSLHTAMVHTMSDLDSLFIDLKGHPKRYVHFSLFGKKEKKAKK